MKSITCEVIPIKLHLNYFLFRSRKNIYISCAKPFFMLMRYYSSTIQLIWWYRILNLQKDLIFDYLAYQSYITLHYLCWIRKNYQMTYSRAEFPLLMNNYWRVGNNLYKLEAKQHGVKKSWNWLHLMWIYCKHAN